VHSHAHSHRGATGRVLGWSLAATFGFVAVEIFAGIEAHSLALLSDAGHNFTDALALLLAWFGFLPGSQARERNQDLRLSPRRRSVGVRECADAAGSLGLDLLRKRAPLEPPAGRSRRAS